MPAIILSVGDELTLGQTIDTNSAWLSQQLAAIGINVLAHITVPDDETAIEQAILESTQRCDTLIVTGGIGPTPDDLTRQALAAVMKEPLEQNEQWLQRLQDFWARRNQIMPEMNRIQAMIPRGATLLDNPIGTAAGIRASLCDGCDVFVLPGVPKEMKLMFEQSILPLLRERSGGAVILSKTLHTFGLGESKIAELLGPLMDRSRNPSVGTTVSNGIVSIRINSRFPSRDEAQSQLDATTADCRHTALGDIIFGQDDQTLPQVVASLLIDQKKTIATAESCTGGLLAKLLTDIPGSSAYFPQGWVTYSNDAKHSLLHVPSELIKEHGAVSEAVVKSMAHLARRAARADYALAISGIAGPSGGTPNKPVGTVCISLAYDDTFSAPQTRFSKSECHTRTFLFSGDREWIRDRSAKMALTMLRFRLLGKPMPF